MATLLGRIELRDRSVAIDTHPVFGFGEGERAARHGETAVYFTNPAHDATAIKTTASQTHATIAASAGMSRMTNRMMQAVMPTPTACRRDQPRTSARNSPPP